MSINTDARAITPVTLRSEYDLLTNVFDWTKEHFLRCNLEAVKHAFCDEELKEQLKEKIIAAYNI